MDIGLIFAIFCAGFVGLFITDRVRGRTEDLKIFAAIALICFVISAADMIDEGHSLTLYAQALQKALE